MRLFRVIRLPQRAAALAVLLTVGLSGVRAQYTAGASGGDGYSTAGVRYAVLDGASLNAPAYFAGSSGGDGYDVRGITYIKLDGNALPTQVYTASSNGGDGYGTAGRIYLPLNGAPPVLQPYSASTSGGDGYSTMGFFNRAVDGAAALLATYTGGAGDGYDADGLENEAIDPNAALLVIYSGGPGDGYDTLGTGYAYLGNPDFPDEIYAASESGGDGYDFDGLLYDQLDGTPVVLQVYTASESGGDGYDRDGLVYYSLNGEVAPAFAYRGASGDGYDENGLIYFALDPAAPPAARIFAGGAGDGYDMMTLPFVQYFGGGAAASGITFAGWLNSRFSEEERAAGLGAPGVDADGDGMVNLLEFAIGGDPRVPDAIAAGPQFRLSNLSDFGLPALPDYFLTGFIRRNPLAMDATLRVEVTDDVTSLWSTNDTVLVDSVPSAFIVRDKFGVDTAPRRAMRVRATLGP